MRAIVSGMTDTFVAFLVAHAAETAPHTGGGLLDHLLGTAALLRQWGARETLVRAGLFHSVYGTESYRNVVVPPTLRGEVRALVGEEAEAIVWRFGAMEKDSLYANLSRAHTYSITDRFSGETCPLSSAELADQYELTVANWLEQRPRVPANLRGHRQAELLAMRPRLSPGACAAIEEAYAG